MSLLASSAQNLLGRLALIGADPRDDRTCGPRQSAARDHVPADPAHFRSVGRPVPAFGSPVGSVPNLYFFMLVGALVLFAYNHDFRALLVIGRIDILLAPTLSMIPLGGFLPRRRSRAMGHPGAARRTVFGAVRSAIRWYIAFLAVFVGSGMAGAHPRPDPAAVPDWFTTTMLALNVTIGGTIVFTLLALFAQQRNDALSALRRAGQGREPAAEHPAAVDRRAAEGTDAADRRSVQRGVDPVRRRRRFHAAGREPNAGRGGRRARRLFSHFDALAERHGLEKIKTIGDAYMVAAGVPSRGPTTPRRWPRWRSTCSRRCARARRRPPGPGAAGRHQLGAGRGRRHRSQAVPLRPMGRRGEHGQPHGVAGRARAGSRSRGRPTSCSRTSSCASRAA